jgi:spore coat protein CotF
VTLSPTALSSTDLQKFKKLLMTHAYQVDLMFWTKKYFHSYNLQNQVGPLGQVTLKSGSLKKRRNIVLVDTTKFSVVACVWLTEKDS